ncbi:MAG: hypothetical protein ACJ72K_10295 [Friedmanniella sp.]
MRSSRTARQMVGSLSAAAVSVLLLGGAAAVASDGSAGHGLRTSTTQTAEDGLQLAAFSTSELAPAAGWTSAYDLSGHGLSGHGLSGHGLNGHGLNGHGLNGHGLNGHGLSGHGLSAAGSSTAGHGLQATSYGHGL